MRARTRIRRIVAMIGLAVAAGVLMAAPAAAQDVEPEFRDDDQVVLHGRLVVPEGETVGTAVIFDGPVRIEGTVEESLVVFNGNVTISGTVGESVVVFNGEVVLRPGARVGGDLVTREDPVIMGDAVVEGSQQRISGRIDFGEIGFASRIAWWVGYSVSTLILGLFLLLVAPGLDAAVVRVARPRFGASAGFGALFFFVLPIVAAILLVTIVGIPLGLFVLLAIGLVYTVGYVVGIHAVGRFVMKEPSSRFVAFLVGWLIFRVIGLVPALGGLAWTLAAIFGFGVLLVAARRSPEQVEAALAPPEPAPVPPAPV
jgi:hypothetical protein